MTRAPASHIYFSQRLRLHFVDWGNSDKPAMVVVHGIHDHCRTWDGFAEAFGESHRLVAPDLRGHGDSEWLRGAPYGYLDYVYDLHQLVEQAGLAPMTLVGHSMGGAIAALFAGVYPELVSKLVLIEGIGLWRDMAPPEPVAQRIRDWVDGTRSLAARLPRRYDSLSEAYQRMQHANPQLSEEQALHLTIHGSNQNEDGTFSWKYDNYTHNFSAGSVSAEETIELWQRVSCPVLILNAENGMEHRIGQDGTDAHFAQHHLIDVANAGHWTYHDDPQAVIGHIERFLADSG